MILTLANNLKLPLHKLRKIHVKEFDESEPPIDPGKPECASLAVVILTHEGKRMSAIREIRERNYRRLDEAFAETEENGCRLFSQFPARFAPFVYPLRIAGGKTREIMIYLNKIGIPAHPWSDLSPEVKNSAEYPLSNILRRDIMVLPIHQDLSRPQVDWMIREVRKAVSRYVNN